MCQYHDNHGTSLPLQQWRGNREGYGSGGGGGVAGWMDKVGEGVNVYV